jgi:hypothetical protein
LAGGSADAAAALRLLARLNGIAPNDPILLEVAAGVGADVPVCLDSRARLMAGIGEKLGPVLRLPPLFAVLVNPGVGVETVAVFRALGLKAGEAISEARAQNFAAPATAAELLGYLGGTSNDLAAPAQRGRADDRRGFGTTCSIARLPARADVGLGRDLLRDVRRLRCQRCCGQGVAARAAELVGEAYFAELMSVGLLNAPAPRRNPRRR